MSEAVITPASAHASSITELGQHLDSRAPEFKFPERAVLKGRLRAENEKV